MILTKAKIEQLPELHSGATTFVMDLGASCGNYWVDWANAFVELCQNRLGLEIEAGPGTSIGRIQDGYGPTRYQYDCDWTQVDGRVPGHEYQERGFTQWKGVEPWVSTRYPNGIDTNNRRFDFIVWFTTPSTDNRPERNGERLGLRFKYPLTCERGYGCCYYISATPSCQPWFNNLILENTARLDYRFGEYNGRTGIISKTADTNKSYSRVIYGCNAAEIYDTNVQYLRENHPWSHYVEAEPTAEQELYSVYGSTYSSYTPAKYRSEGYNTFQYIVSKNKDTVDLRIKKEDGVVVFDILYGNLMEEQVTEDNIVTNSFVMVSVDTTHTYMANYLLTENGFSLSPSKQVIRPTSINYDRRLYWGVSRLLLDKQYIHCADLYQVFSFSDLMNKIDYNEKVFVDKNGLEHKFIIFNYGMGGSDAARIACPAFAMPV